MLHLISPTGKKKDTSDDTTSCMQFWDMQSCSCIVWQGQGFDMELFIEGLAYNSIML